MKGFYKLKRRLKQYFEIIWYTSTKANENSSNGKSCYELLVNHLRLGLNIRSQYTIRNAQSDNYIYSNKDGRFNSYGCNPQFKDQLFNIIRVASSAGGHKYSIRGVNSGKCIYSNGARSEFSHYDCNSEWDDQHFQFIPV